MEEFPPGFRFYPTEEELVLFYLVKKLEGNREDLNRVFDRIIPVLDIYDFNPWDLPRNSGEICLGDPEQWFFFIPRQESEARGGRPKRLTSTGYWKATGSPSFVYSSSSSSSNNNSESTNVIVGAIGLKKTMVFYTGRAPNGTKTEWKMNEYKAIDGDHKKLRQEFSLCRVYKKSKCLRAFDRRPHDLDVIRRNPTIRIQLPAAAPSTHGLGAANHPDNSTTHSTLSISDIPNTYVDVERRRLSSPESSSSSGDRGEPSQSGQSTTGSCLPMDVDDVEIQWDQFDQDWLN